MYFHRFVIFNDDHDEDFWVCEDCLCKLPDYYECVDCGVDKYGHLECEYCGLHFDHDEMKYVT